MLSAWLFWITVWQYASMLMGQRLLLVSPFAVGGTLLEQITQLSFWETILYSMHRILAGFFLATFLGVALATLSARYQALRILLHPLNAVITATPVVSFIMLALVWMSSRSLSMFISFLMVFPVLYTSALTGIQSVDVKLMEMAHVFRIPKWRRVIYIYLPDILPHLISAWSVSMGLSFKSGVAAEVLGQASGTIGDRLYRARLYLDTAELFAWTVVIIAVSVSVERLMMVTLNAIQRRLERAIRV